MDRTTFEAETEGLDPCTLTSAEQFAWFIGELDRGFEDIDSMLRAAMVIENATDRTKALETARALLAGTRKAVSQLKSA